LKHGAGISLGNFGFVVAVARAGNIGYGKVRASDVTHLVRVRTGETGPDALCSGAGQRFQQLAESGKAARGRGRIAGGIDSCLPDCSDEECRDRFNVQL
jgi:hypothetical protein